MQPAHMPCWWPCAQYNRGCLPCSRYCLPCWWPCGRYNRGCVLCSPKCLPFWWLCVPCNGACLPCFRHCLPCFWQKHTAWQPMRSKRAEIHIEKLRGQKSHHYRLIISRLARPPCCCYAGAVHFLWAFYHKKIGQQYS